MVNCQITLSCDKRIGTYTDLVPDIRKEGTMRFELSVETVEELTKCLPDAVWSLLDGIEKLDEQCEFDTEEELKAYNKYYSLGSKSNEDL